MRCKFVYDPNEPKPLSIFKQLEERHTSNCENYCTINAEYCTLHIPKDKE